MSLEDVENKTKQDIRPKKDKYLADGSTQTRNGLKGRNGNIFMDWPAQINAYKCLKSVYSLDIMYS